MEYSKVKMQEGFLYINDNKIDYTKEAIIHYKPGSRGIAEVTLKVDANVEAEGRAEIKKINDEVKNNTVTQQKIDDLFDKSEKKIEKYWDKCTVMTVQLPNGFTLVEHSACVDPKNYDEKIGIEICERKIKDKLWELEGYKLQCQLGKLK